MAGMRAMKYLTASYYSPPPAQERIAFAFEMLKVMPLCPPTPSPGTLNDHLRQLQCTSDMSGTWLHAVLRLSNAVTRREVILQWNW